VCPPADPMPTEPAAWAALDEDSQWVNGPWVIELAADVRDTLGAVAPADIPGLGAAWSRIDEFGDAVDEAHCAQLVRTISAFAGDAVSRGEMIYVWCCL
jgi:hypothetical protein